MVCEERLVPAGILKETGFRALEFEGPFPFGLTGILDSVLHPLAQAWIGIFAMSTYDTDYVLRLLSNDLTTAFVEWLDSLR